MKYFYLTVVAIICAFNAMAMEADDSTKSQISSKKPQLSLRTVMNPDGVTQDKWKEMFEGERRSIINRVKSVNEYIELFNNFFKKCSPTDLEAHSTEYKQRFNEELTTDAPSIQINSLDSIENLQSTIENLRRVKKLRSHLLFQIPGLRNTCNVDRINTVLENCDILLESFKTPLTPIQFVQADAAHKNGIKGKGAKVLVLEQDLVCEHSFFKNNDKIKVGEYLFKEEYEGHGPHVTGIVHQIAPEAEISVEQVFNTKFILSTPIKIINTSYSIRIPLFHLLSKKKQQAIKEILSDCKIDAYKINLTKEIHLIHRIEKIFRNPEKFNSSIRYLTEFLGKPHLDLAYEEDYAGTVIKKVIQKSYDDAKELLQEAINLFKDKLRIQAFGNSYKEKNWRYDDLPSLLMEDEFLDQSIMVMNIDRENKLYGSSNRPDHTLGKIIQTVLKNNGVDDPKLVDQKLQRVQASSLSTLGTNVWSADSDDGYELRTGTSLAAPMVSGVAGLIEGIHPEFSEKEIRECLLNSASRQFVIGTGEDALHVIDLPQDQIDLLNEKNLGLRKYIAFDPSQYGKGILDAEAALKYAAFKVQIVLPQLRNL